VSLLRHFLNGVRISKQFQLADTIISGANLARFSECFAQNRWNPPSFFEHSKDVKQSPCRKLDDFETQINLFRSAQKKLSSAPALAS
jgi:hypothetical protein